MSYTIDQLDAAIQAIHGNYAVRRDDPSWSRPYAMERAAAFAWITQRLDAQDDHAAVLREALVDPAKTGLLKPSDGVWPTGW